MRAVGYLRVSTDEQAERGVSLAAQRAKVEAYAGLYQLELVEVVVDAGVSAKSLDRPGLRRALAMLQAGEAAALVVLKLDRLTRSVRDLGELLDRQFGNGGAALLSVAENLDTRSAVGRMVLNIMASVAQWERESICERTKTVLDHKRTLGHRTGSIPYGLRVGADGCTLEAHPGEQAIILRARQLRSGRSLSQISAALEAEGMVSRKGSPFLKPQVQRMLAGPG